MAFHPGPPPRELRTARVVLRPLRATDVERDYDAVMSDPAALRRWSQSDWPADDFPLSENLADLERHEREHEEGVAFTYTVLSAGHEERCLGCVYLAPTRPETAALTRGAGHPMKLAFWVRSSEIASDLDRHLFESLRRWLDAEWSFDCVLMVIGASDERQLSIVGDALGAGTPTRLNDGRECLVFVERTVA
jgi:RimJ/RimL family protein N-acetyltransferase